MVADDYEYDFFICHASEDKKDFVDELARSLVDSGAKVWYDDFVLEVGMSLRGEIEKGLSTARCGVVVVSPAFFTKQWPQNELSGLTALHSEQPGRILPVWHKIDKKTVAESAPMLADIVAAKSSAGVAKVVESLTKQKAPKKGSPMRRSRLLQMEHRWIREPGPNFRSRPLANARAYAGAIIGALPESAAVFTEDQRDFVEKVFRKIQPSSTCWRDLPEFIVWHVTDRKGGGALWSAQLYPGPVVHMIREMTLQRVDAGRGQSVQLSQLVRWWNQALCQEEDLVYCLGGPPEVAVSLTFNPYPSGGPPVTSVDFGAAPCPHRSAEAHQIPPWAFTSYPIARNAAGAIIPGAIADLLQQLSYRRAAPTIAWVSEQLHERSSVTSPSRPTSRGPRRKSS